MLFVPFAILNPILQNTCFGNVILQRKLFFSTILSYCLPSDLAMDDWSLSVVCCGDSFSIQLIYFMLHKIWLSRNELLYKKKQAWPVKIDAGALECVLEFNKGVPSKGNLVLDAHQEDRSQNDMQIMPINAGVFEDGVAAYVCVNKNQHNVISLATCSIEFVSVEPAVAEVLSVRRGLTLAKNLKMEDRFVVQTDALVVVDCTNAIKDYAVIELVASDCRGLLGSFNLSCVVFINRSCNVDAHNLVKLSKLYGSRTWIGGFPAMDPFPSVSRLFL